MSGLSKRTIGRFRKGSKHIKAALPRRQLELEPNETTPLTAGRVEDVRGKLQAVLDAWPRHGERIPQD